MSDFDKEAEREKLREKFEKEEDNRAATEQMSELLLKGATMTNAHCSECGDPIFRYDGQEFCPTCQKPVARDTQENGADPSATDEQGGQADDGDQIEVADPSDEARVQFGDGDEAAASAPDTTDDSTAPPEAGGAQSTRQSDHSEPAPQTARTGTSSEPSGRTANDQPRGTASQNPPVSARQTQSTDSHTDDIAANMDAASASLAETARRFAERAAATENPREAREHLQAAREAAEALDAARF
ncbi:Sjogren's syndrome/scleroderma autoantigen 1 family protein [Haloarcula sp. CBA1127]|uniref:Sjogren's syndrome/scleroderma autoantigen 1 family protein n=1 Tax=Haloarcula sp. CBA1127 TaxID=1765055 RepID=UPI00073F1F65|nr:Sjogren's syndrome/scleroderma autoantigen 1 family protein [Haloarcula sp. CBA1127]